jgi:hypothetical protein
MRPTTNPTNPSTAERGQTLPLVALLLASAIAMAAVVAHVAVRASARAGLESAADATALAGAVGGRVDAAQVAAENDVELVAFTRTGDVVTVHVQRDGRDAVARAEAIVVLTGR